MKLLPEGEQLRKAIRWISKKRIEHPDASFAKLIDDACLGFDLSPKDAVFLKHFFAEKVSEKSK